MQVMEGKGRLLFSKDQIVTPTQASKNFGEIRRKAATTPQFVTGRGGVDTVIVGYDEFERLCLELERYREAAFYDTAARRLAQPSERIPFEEALGEVAYSDLMSIDYDAISDAELFE